MFCKKGFTLVEVLMVIVIIGILAAATLPRLISHNEKFKATEATGMMSAIRRGMLRYYDSYGRFPFLPYEGTFTDILGIDIALTPQGTSQYGWTFLTGSSDAGQTQATITGSQFSNSSDCAGNLYLDVVSGVWSGDGDYDSTNGGKCWTNLNK